MSSSVVTPEPCTSPSNRSIEKIQILSEGERNGNDVALDTSASDDDVADQPSCIAAAVEETVDGITNTGFVGVSAAIGTAGIIYDAVIDLKSRPLEQW